MHAAAAPECFQHADSTVPSTAFASIEEALEELAAGRMVVVIDDHDRENEGDLVMAAQFVTPEAINFMTRRAGGWICLALTTARCEELGLAPMAPTSDALHRTPFTVTIEARSGVTTGISVRDQAHTMHVAIEPEAGPDEIRIGGHVHPLKARPHGVLERPGHTEAAVDLARLAGLNPAGVICEIQNEDGSMARTPDLLRYSRQHGLKMITIADLIEFRQQRDRCVERVVETRMPTAFGEFSVIGYRSLRDEGQHAAFVKGDVVGKDDVLVRIHPKCLTGDVFHSRLCDCGRGLETAMALIEQEGRGVVLYLSREGRGISLLDQLNAYRRKEQLGRHAVDPAPDPGAATGVSDDGIEAQILRDLGLVGSIRLLTNGPEESHALERYDIRAAAQALMPGAPICAHSVCDRMRRKRAAGMQQGAVGGPGRGRASSSSLHLPSAIDPPATHSLPGARVAQKRSRAP